jgi:hypothetical protein
MRSLPKQLAASSVFIATVAFTLRLLILYLSWHRGAVADAVPFGYEAGQVAKSIVSGRGFSSPFTLVETGPTAFLSPVYPYLLAAIFKLWGIYTVRSHIAVEAINCLFSAVTVFPLYSIAKRSYGIGVAAASSWVWVILPSAWHAPIADVWDTSATVFFLTLLVWATLRLRSQARLEYWLGYGVLWAVGVSLNATLIALLPFCLAWLGWDLRRQPVRASKLIFASLFFFVVGLTPWTVRNYSVFRKLVPLRSTLGLELWLGNNADTRDVRSFSLHPLYNEEEAYSFKTMGEMSYMSLKLRTAVDFIRSNPGLTAVRIAKRTFDFWFAVTDRPQNAWASDPMYVQALFILNFTLVSLGWFGLAWTWRTMGLFEVAPYVAVVFVYPLVYYLTHTLVRYRYPIEPILVILSVYGLAQVVASAHKTRFNRSPILPGSI